jgi:hypothetical protein
VRSGDAAVGALKMGLKRPGTRAGALAEGAPFWGPQGMPVFATPYPRNQDYSGWFACRINFYG